MDLLRCLLIIVSCNPENPGIMISYGSGCVILPTVKDIPDCLLTIWELEFQGKLRMTSCTDDQVIFQPTEKT